MTVSTAALAAPKSPYTVRAGDVRPPGVLVVDDDRAVRESLRFLLAGAGMEVSIAAGVGEAARRLAERRFEVVITDWSMPGGGRRWIEYVLRSQPNAAVIVITAALDVASGLAAALRDAGCVVLGKPVPAASLLEVLKRTTRGSQDDE
jgi:DNA-binding NtrC family response regulator